MSFSFNESIKKFEEIENPEKYFMLFLDRMLTAGDNFPHDQRHSRDLPEIPAAKTRQIIC